MWFCVGDEIKDKVAQVVCNLATREIAKPSSRFHDANFDLIPVWDSLRQISYCFYSNDCLIFEKLTPMPCCPSVHYETRFTVCTFDRSNGFPNIGEGTRRKLCFFYEDDGEIGPTTNMRNALARVLRYTSYCYTLVSLDAWMVFPTSWPVRLHVPRRSFVLSTTKERGVVQPPHRWWTPGRSQWFSIRYDENSWWHARPGPASTVDIDRSRRFKNELLSRTFSQILE